jgi:hypothetical protein
MKWLQSWSNEPEKVLDHKEKLSKLKKYLFFAI